jgi:hypothetical protein
MKRSQMLEHLGDLATVRVFRNDRQVRQVSYREEAADRIGYTVTVWSLRGGAAPDLEHAQP